MSPRTSQQFQEIREQSKVKILEAATELFASRGFHNTSIAQIAKQAGVAKGLIYNYFDKKEDLMSAIVFSAFEQGGELISQIMTASPGKERLHQMFELSFSFIEERLEFQRLMAQLSLQLQYFPELAEIVKSKYQGSMPLMAQMLRDADHPDPEREARLLAATMDGLGLQYIVMGDALPLAEIKQDLINKYCK